MQKEALLSSKVVDGKQTEGAKFSDYFSHSEQWAKTPSHRALAMLRGRNEGFLQLKVDVEHDKALTQVTHPCIRMIAKHAGIKDQQRPADKWLAEVARWTWIIKLQLKFETELLTAMRQRAETAAIDVFGQNLTDLLLAAPAGQKATIGLDPGLRTGVKIAVLDATGKVLDHGAIFPTPPQNRIAEAEQVLLAMCAKHNVELIAIGNGTAYVKLSALLKGC